MVDFNTNNNLKKAFTKLFVIASISMFSDRIKMHKFSKLQAANSPCYLVRPHKKQARKEKMALEFSMVSFCFASFFFLQKRDLSGAHLEVATKSRRLPKTK